MRMIIDVWNIAKEYHASGFPINNIAEAMVHTPEVHLQNYSRFKPRGTTEMYRNSNKANLVA